MRYVKELDIEFGRFIKERDSNGAVFRCISCGRVLPVRYAECGHYISRSHMATRWDEDNCHAECHECNEHDVNHLDGYTVHLREKIGEQRYEELLARGRGFRKWSERELRELLAYYREKNNHRSRLPLL